MRPLLAVIVLVAAACSMSADAKVAEAAVDKFHTMLDAGEFEAIYVGSSEDLKNVSTRDRFVALLEAVHRKLGNSKSSKEQSWNVNYHTSGIFVTLVYVTSYAEGDASEQFVYRLQGSRAQLAGYHINSEALVLK